MDQATLHILRKFREDDDPVLVDYNGKCLSTLSRPELLNIAKEKNVDLEDIILIGGIDGKRENIVLYDERLKIHLTAINLYQGETSHCSRRGCANTLRMLGVNDQAINEHVGWSSKGMIEHYTNAGKLMGPVGPAQILSTAAKHLGQGSSLFDKVSQNYANLSKLKQYEI